MHPRNTDLELFDITYVQCDDAEIEREIDEKITQFIERVKKHLNRKHQDILESSIPYPLLSKQAAYYLGNDLC